MKGKSRILSLFALLVCLFVNNTPAFAQDPGEKAAPAPETQLNQAEPVDDATLNEESQATDTGIFGRAWQGGFVVFLTLMILVLCSVASWAILVAKYFHLKKLGVENDNFIKSFWESRSLNDLNGRLSDYADSPSKEVFRAGYAELVKGSHLKEQGVPSQLAVHAAVDNLGRSLNKAKSSERRLLEKHLTILATVASAAPFVGLFGTVWGIMGAFEGIARSGSASLAAVAPGISEALIATAFGLAAAIPAAVGYNFATYRIKGLLGLVDGFAVDFLNIVERYLVSDRSKHQTPTSGL